MSYVARLERRLRAACGDGWLGGVQHGRVIVRRYPDRAGLVRGRDGDGDARDAAAEAEGAQVSSGRQMLVHVVEKSGGSRDGARAVGVVIPVGDAEQVVFVVCEPLQALMLAAGLVRAANECGSYDPRPDREANDPMRRLWRWVRSWW